MSFYKTDAKILIGNGDFFPSSTFNYLSEIFPIVAVDGGANTCKQLNIIPETVIGDLDSCSSKNLTFFRERGVSIKHIKEQDTTDFEKALYSINTDIYFCFGFTGGEVDHELSLLHIIRKYNYKKIILFSENQLFFLLPNKGKLVVTIGERVSFFPIKTSLFDSSTGLKYPLNGLALEQGKVIGTSNESISNNISWDMKSGYCLGFFPIKTPLINIVELLKVSQE